MPTSANITTAGDIAFTLPVGTWGVRVINESDTLIRRLLGQPAATSGASLGLPLAAGAGETLVFKQPLKQAVSYCAIHGGSGNKTLTYEIITQPTQGGTGPSSSTGSGGASNALLLAGTSAATLGSLTAAATATGGLLYGTQGGADRKFTLTAAGAALAEAADAAAQRTVLGLGTMATQAASAVAITGGTATGLTGLGIRSTGAAFDLTLATSEVLTAGRKLSFVVDDADRTLTVPATGTAALLGTAQTFTAANIFTVNGAASSPAMSLTGTVFTGGSATTTKPLFLIEPAGTTSTGWSTDGTMLGVNAPSGFIGRIFDCQLNGVSFFKVKPTETTLTSPAGSYLSVVENVIHGGYSNSTTNRPSLEIGVVFGSSILARVGGISGNDFFGVTAQSNDANVNLQGFFATYTARTFTIGASAKDAGGGYTGDGHMTAVVGGKASAVTTGGAGGALTLTGGAAAGSGDNNGGDVVISGGAKTGSGTAGLVKISSLPTTNPGPGILWNNTGIPAIGT